MLNPLIFMTSVAGKPDETRIKNYLEQLKQGGIEQVMVYPRSGCELEYMSDEWFAAVAAFLKHAKRLGMKIWLYDDFNWPSGDCGGRVTKRPEFRLQSLRITGEQRGKLNSGSGNDLYFGENNFTNLMSHEAVEYFIELTHEQYYARFCEYFGNVIVGIFTDEPAVGYSCDAQSVPYYAEMPQEYTAAFGRDLFQDIEDEYEDLSKNCMEIISKRFRDTYIKKLADWSKAHGILLTGHLMNDNSPFKSVRSCGNILTVLPNITVPGIDEIYSDFSKRREMHLMNVIQYAAGENGAMAELFALGPCNLSYMKKRCMLFFCAAFKIDHYFLAISHMDFRGNGMITDYFSEFGADQPDFAGMKLLADEACTAAKLARKDYTPDVYVRIPVERYAKRLTNPLPVEPVTKLTNALTYAQVQWKYINVHEQVSNAPVIEFEEDLTYRLGDLVTDNADQIVKAVAHTVTVTDPNGNTVKGLFVRRFEDGSLLVLNLFAPAGWYQINGAKRYLFENDVFYGNAEEFAQPAAKVQPADVTFEVAYQNQNITRAFSTEKENRVTKIISNGDQTVSFALLNGETVWLDDQPLKAAKPTALSTGFDNLYTDTAEMVLKSGAHTLKLSNDYPYLPAAFILGNFTAEYSSENIGEVTLNAPKTCLNLGERLTAFGTALLKTKVTVPQNATHIELTGTKLYNTVFVNGQKIGEGITAPYRFALPSGCLGEVELVVEQRTAMAPMFGDVDKYPKFGKLVQENDNSPAVKIGLDGVNFILAD